MNARLLVEGHLFQEGLCRLCEARLASAHRRGAALWTAKNQQLLAGTQSPECTCNLAQSEGSFSQIHDTCMSQPLPVQEDRGFTRVRLLLNVVPKVPYCNKIKWAQVLDSAACGHCNEQESMCAPRYAWDRSCCLQLLAGRQTGLKNGAVA